MPPSRCSRRAGRAAARHTAGRTRTRAPHTHRPCRARAPRTACRRSPPPRPGASLPHRRAWRIKEHSRDSGPCPGHLRRRPRPRGVRRRLPVQVLLCILRRVYRPLDGLAACHGRTAARGRSCPVRGNTATVRAWWPPQPQCQANPRPTTRMHVPQMKFTTPPPARAPSTNPGWAAPNPMPRHRQTCRGCIAG